MTQTPQTDSALATYCGMVDQILTIAVNAPLEKRVNDCVHSMVYGNSVNIIPAVRAVIKNKFPQCSQYLENLIEMKYGKNADIEALMAASNRGEEVGTGSS